MDLIKPTNRTTLQTATRQCYDNDVQLPKCDMEATKLGYGAVAPSLFSFPSSTWI